jgi:WD40 repeat protein
VGRDDEVLVVDLAGAQIICRRRVAAKVHSLDYNPDNRALAVGYRDAAFVSTFDPTADGVLANLAVGSMQETVVAWHSDGKRLAAAGSNPQIQIWDVPAKRRLAVLTGHVQQVTCLSFHPDGGLLASGSWDGVLRLWQPSTGRPLMQMPLSSLARFSVDGRWLGPVWPGDQQYQLLEVASTPEYRTIVSSLGAGEGAYYLGDIRPDGRLFALAMGGSARLWDLANGQELATLPGAAEFVFFDRSGPEWNLLVCGADGFKRWPVVRRDDAGHSLAVGPPKTLSSRTQAGFCRTSDGLTLAGLCSTAEPLELFDLTHPSRPRQLGPHPMAGRIALSRDGAWAASAGWHSDRVRLWNAKTGKLVHEWKFGVENDVFFLPDSRALIISHGDSYEFWDVGSLQLIRRLQRDVALYPGYVAFSPDGKLMALEMAPAVVHLKEVDTGRTIVKLEDPHGDRATWMAFTPDGAKLVVVGLYARAIHLWDLRLIREQLKRMHLDWDWPEFPPAPRAETAPAPLTIEVRIGIRQLLGTFWR